MTNTGRHAVALSAAALQLLLDHYRPDARNQTTNTVSQNKHGANWCKLRPRESDNNLCGVYSNTAAYTKYTANAVADSWHILEKSQASYANRTSDGITFSGCTGWAEQLSGTSVGLVDCGNVSSNWPTFTHRQWLLQH